MDRLHYLADPDVRGFTRYLRGLVIEGNGAVLGVGKGSRRRPVRSLLDAQLAFRWRGRDFSQVNRDLETFRTELRAALAACAGGGSDCGSALAQYELLYVCMKVLEWANLVKGALGYVTERAQSEGLSDCLVRAAAVLDGDSDDAREFDAHELRHGPGMARLYAAMNDRTVAYNGRTAAALCLLCRHYLSSRGATGTIPKLISFRLTTTKARHDPSRARALRFRRITSDSEHARWNIRANWIIDAIAGDHALAARLGGKRRERMRRIEAALFMIGDDVCTRPVRIAGQPRAIPPQPTSLSASAAAAPTPPRTRGDQVSR